MTSDNWLEQLEARLEQQLEAFLHDNPEQRRRLERQAARDRQQRLVEERLQLQQQAEAQRRALLELAQEIRLWQQRVERARGAGANDLVERAERHQATLMEQGRSRWQQLSQLGERFRALEAELAALSDQDNAAAGTAAATGPSQPGRTEQAGGGATEADFSPEDKLAADWARFETQQELQELRRRLNL